MPTAADFGDPDDPNVATEMARAVLAEVNALRRDPRAYGEQMAQLQDCYEGQMLTYPHTGIEVETVESYSALMDCLSDLSNAAPLPAVMSAQSISRSCQQHLADLRVNNCYDHIGSDGSTPEERLSRVGEYREQCGENAVFGMRSAREIVWHMLLDDGSPERGQRANLLNHDLRFAGAAFGSHPDGGTTAVLLLVDTFKAKPATKVSQMKGISESHLGEAAPEEHHPHHGTHKHWDRLSQDTKPAHLRVPQKVFQKVHEMDKPRLYIKPRDRPSMVYVGQLSPQATVNPVVVRAFVHRADGNYDDALEENDCLGLCHKGHLRLSPDDVAVMFDEICERRPIGEQRRRQLSWKEVCGAVQTKKRYVPVVDLSVETTSGRRHILVVETDVLRSWCAAVHAEFSTSCAAPLPSPPSAGSGSKGPRNSAGSAKAAELSAFLGAVASAELGEPGSGRRLQDEPKVRQVLRLGCGMDGGADGGAERAEKVVCMSQRKLWAFQVRPHRDAWLSLIKAAGLNPLIPLSETVSGKPSAEQIQAIAIAHAAKEHANVARSDPKVGSAVPYATGKMATRDLPQKVQVRSSDVTTKPRDLAGSVTAPSADLGDEGEADASPSARSAGAGDSGDATRYLGATSAEAGNTAVHPWEERRLQTETLVNQVLHGSANLHPAVAAFDASVAAGDFDLGACEGDGALYPAGGYPAAAGQPAAAAAAPMAYTFEARRKFTQVLGAQNRASDERRFLSSQQCLGRSLTSEGSLRRGHGAGAHSLSAPTGLRGHFHSHLAAHGAESSHAWPGSLHRLDGEHIDHTRMPEMKPDPKYSKMDAKERAKQWNCLHNKQQNDPHALRHKIAEDQYRDNDQWRVAEHEFRSDCPQRHGKFGRRAFDPQVRHRPLPNPNNISEVDTKPSEERVRQHERMHDLLSRSLPLGQSAHFETHLPKAKMPHKYEDMVSRDQVKSIMDLGMKRPEHGFFQNRHSDIRDMNLYTRPTGITHVDRMVPMA